MTKKILLAGAFAAVLSGCASVDMASKEDSSRAKEFNSPSEGKAGIYVYRDSIFGASIKKDIYIDKKCLGESAPKVFFHTEVAGDKDYDIATESEFSENYLKAYLVAGKNYFIRQYIKMGAFVGGANLEMMDEKVAMTSIKELELAKSGKCDKSLEKKSR